MPAAFDEAFRRVKELVADFKANENFYLSAQFSEAQARKDFIDKFFIALGWDVNHDTQRNPYEQEVKIEKKRVGRRHSVGPTTPSSSRPTSTTSDSLSKPKSRTATLRRPRTTFRRSVTAGVAERRWRYLTDFRRASHRRQPLARPISTTALHRGRKKFDYADYVDPDKFAKIYWLFSREAVARRVGGRNARRSAAKPSRKSKTSAANCSTVAYQSPVDEAFLDRTRKRATVKDARQGVQVNQSRSGQRGDRPNHPTHARPACFHPFSRRTSRSNRNGR